MNPRDSFGFLINPIFFVLTFVLFTLPTEFNSFCDPSPVLAQDPDSNQDVEIENGTKQKSNKDIEKEIEAEIDRRLQDTLVQKEQSVFTPTPRQVLRPLFRADRAIRENESARAVTLIGEVLSDSTSDDYLVPVTGMEGISSSLRLHAQDILASLPKKDRKLYRLRYGVQAKQMLEKAIEKGDFDGVSQVMQRFFLTDAGFDAAMLLGHYHMDEGRPIAAANCFQRITESDEGRAIHDPEASVLLATCWLLGNSPKRATAVLTDLKMTTNESSIEFMGKPVELFDSVDQATPWLTKLIGDSPLRNIDSVNQWVMSGGNAQRNARSGTGFPLFNPRWSTITLNDPDAEKLVTKRQRDLIALDSSPIPSVQPLAVGNTIVMRAFDRMIGVDFETGKRVWVFPPWDFTTDFDSSKKTTKATSVSQTPLTERMWMDSIYGQASSDGDKIFVVPEPGFSSNAARRGRAPTPLLQRNNSELYAIDIKRQGAFIWEVGGATGLDEPKLAESLFLGAPLPMGGELFVVCRRKSEIVLVVLDAETGKLNWEQPLGTTETSIKFESDPRRKLAGATPSFADGMLVCSTGTGALVGVDLATRSLAWGYQYSAPGKKAVQPIRPNGQSTADPLGGLWRDSAITIADGKVLFTPVESQELICVDLQNGYPTWDSKSGLTAKTGRLDSLLVACVENGNIILVGETNVRAISLSTGLPVWHTSTIEFGKPSGRGYANRGSYYYPTTAERLVQVDLETGKVVKTVRSNGVLGNLVCYQGEVISHGVDRLSIFPQDEPNRQLVEAAEAQGELTPKLLSLKSQLQVQNGDLKGGIATIESALEQQPNRAYERLLLGWIIELLDQDFEAGLAVAEKHHEALIVRRKYQYMATNVNGMIDAKENVAATEVLFGLFEPVDEIKKLKDEKLEIDARKHDSVVPSSNLTASIIKPTLTIRLDVWIASRLRLVYQRSSAEQKRNIQLRINELAAQFKTTEAIERHEILRTLPLELVDSELRFELIQDLIASQNFSRAHQVLLTFEGQPDGKMAGASYATLSAQMVEAGLHDDALELVSEIETVFADAKVTKDETGKEFAQTLRTKLDPAIEKSVKKIQWEYNHVSGSEGDFTDEDPIRIIPIQVISSDSEKYKSYQFRFIQGSREIAIQDANGTEIHRFSIRHAEEKSLPNYNNYTIGQISIRNNLAVVTIAEEIVVVDCIKLETNKSPMLWSKVIGSGTRELNSDLVAGDWGQVATTPTTNAYVRRIYVSEPGFKSICYVDGNQLIALDPVTGNQLWSRSNLKPASTILGDDKNLIVWNSTKRTADIFDPASGELLKTTVLPKEVGAVWKPYKTRVLVSTLRPVEGLNRPSNKEQPTRKQSDDPDEKPVEKPDPIKRVKTLGFYDLLNDKLIWEKEFKCADLTSRVRATIGCLVENDRIAILEPGKDLAFVDIQTGETSFTAKLKLTASELEDISRIGIRIQAGKYLVHLERGDCPTRTSLNEYNIDYLYINYTQPVWYGTLICIDPETGEDLWDDHVHFDHLQIAQGLPKNSPIYLFLRRVNKTGSQGRTSFAQLIAIDLENGKILTNYLAPQMPGYQATYQISCNYARQQMYVTYDSTRVILQFETVDDLPPTPVAHIAKYNCIPKQLLDSRVDTNNLDAVVAKKKVLLKKAIDAHKDFAEKQAEEKRRLEAEIGAKR